jgi:hypothetical protein
MSCYHLIGVVKKDGTPAYRPCGWCTGCRLEYSRQWAVRCVHEASLHEDNSFLTLTYDDDSLPHDGSVNKRDVQLFMKRLRREIEPKKISFYACGEYGEKMDRPHYHICIFGYDFPDKQVRKARYRFGSKKGFWTAKPDCVLFVSKQVRKLWPYGFHSIGELTFESAGYTARYATKKVGGKEKDTWYEGKRSEFSLMSRSPAIGKNWIDKYLTDVYPKDYFHINGKKQRSNRYYDSRLAKKFPKMYETVKKNREIYAKENGPHSDKYGTVQDFTHRLKGKEKHRKSITKRLERKIEDARNSDDLRNIR